MMDGHISWLGIVIFGIVAASLMFVVLAAVLVKPRSAKSAMIVVGALVAVAALLVGGMWVGGKVFAALMG